MNFLHFYLDMVDNCLLQEGVSSVVKRLRGHTSLSSSSSSSTSQGMQDLLASLPSHANASIG